MICGNTQAEINRDTQTNAQEYALYIADEKIWSTIYHRLLAGESIELLSGLTTSLAERLSDQYYEFTSFVNCGYDFMDVYKQDGFKGRLRPIRDLIEQEASTLASVIVGER